MVALMDAGVPRLETSHPVDAVPSGFCKRAIGNGTLMHLLARGTIHANG